MVLWTLPYKKTSTGNLELIDFIDSKSTEYTYKPTSNGSVDIIVRAEYKKVYGFNDVKYKQNYPRDL